MPSFTSKRRGRRTAKMGLPAWGPFNSRGRDSWTRAPAEATIDVCPAVSSPLSNAAA